MLLRPLLLLLLWRRGGRGATPRIMRIKAVGSRRSDVGLVRLLLPSFLARWAVGPGRELLVVPRANITSRTSAELVMKLVVTGRSRP